MKLRIRFQKSRTTVDVEDGSVNLIHLKEIIAKSFPNINSKEFELSLNGRDGLIGDEVELSTFGIVSGDLLHIICDKTCDKNDKNEISACGPADYAQPSVSGVNRSETSSTDSSNVTAKVDTKHCAKMDLICEQNGVEDVTQTGASEVIQSDSDVLQTTLKLEEPRSMEELIEIQEYLNEPMLCREATETSVPNRLVEVFKNSQLTSKLDALCAVLHVLLLETGFSPTRNAKCEAGLCLPEGWRSTGSYKMSYVHSACNGAACNLVMVPLGSQLMVHGNVSGGEPQTPCKVQLKVTDYVASLDQDVPKVYCNLSKLSRIFKDAVALPLLHKVHAASGNCINQGFMGISNEIKLIILRYLDVPSLLKVSQVSKSLNELTKDPWLWRRNYLLYWPKKSDNNLNQNWYEIYRIEYKRRKDLRERLKRMTPVLPHHPFFPRLGPVSGLVPPPPSFTGIIGGEYDLNPNFGFPDPVFPGTGRRIIPDRHPQLLQPRFDPIGPDPDMNVCIPPNQGRIPHHGGNRYGGRPFFGGMNPRFL